VNGIVVDPAITVAALYIDPLGPYPKLPGVDCWDESRDARKYNGPHPVVAHPPCGPYSRLRWFCKHQPADCAPRAVEQVQRWGGVLEHPASSTLWQRCRLPLPGGLPDEFGGWSVELDQVSYGHRARKRTWLYVVGAINRKERAMQRPRESRGKFVGRFQVTKQVEFTPAEWREQPSGVRRKVTHECDNPADCYVFVCRDTQGFSCGRYSCQAVGSASDNRCSECWCRRENALKRERVDASDRIRSVTFAHANEAWALYSPCKRYRYALAWPTGRNQHRIALLIAANPSTATEHDTDPTVARWVERCARMDYGWALVANVRAWRETDPAKVPADPEAIEHSPAVNDAFILELAKLSQLVVCGWGTLGGERGTEVLSTLSYDGVRPHALKLNRDGSPTHPLYLSYSLKPFPMRSM